MQNTKTPYMETKASHKDQSRIFQSVIIPMAVFLLSMTSINIFQNYGRLLMAPLLGAMWAGGAGCAFYMRSQRKEIINQTMMAIGGYCASLLAMRRLVMLTMGVNSSMLMAAMGQPIPESSASAIPGYLQSIMWATSTLVPLSFLAMQASRLLKWRRTVSKNKKMAQLRRSGSTYSK